MDSENPPNDLVDLRVNPIREARHWNLYLEGVRVRGVFAFSLQEGWFEKYQLLDAGGGKTIRMTSWRRTSTGSVRDLLASRVYAAYEIRDAELKVVGVSSHRGPETEETFTLSGTP